MSTPATDEAYSPGLEGVIAGETAISTLATGLTYRGYAAEELAAQASYEEVAYLLLHGELPSANELQAFQSRLGAAANLPDTLIDILAQLPPSTPLMDVMRTGCSLLAHWDPETRDNNHAANLRKAERLLAKLPVVLATRHRLRRGFTPIPADPERSFAANLLWMLHGAAPSSKHEQALDVSLILYAEHEFNASTFAARVICSTQSDLHSSITGAIGTLKGPLHGGANERVLEVLREVGSPDKAEQWVRAALAQKRRIMGFGHRVYRSGDPRATLLKPWCVELAAETGNQGLEQTADIIEAHVRREKNLPPNVDWPCGRLYHYLGLPIDLYTPLFVVARVIGWSAHVIEQLDNNRLMRPRSLYTGHDPRPWVPLDKR
ncbi:MAG TPA: citrate/2-methylcitrate synthase [Pirellulaceae bacterium]|nr:citrate/2-methylcitrate synthase [Pirellulaceae bacterium]